MYSGVHLVRSLVDSCRKPHCAANENFGLAHSCSQNWARSGAEAQGHCSMAAEAVDCSRKL